MASGFGRVGCAPISIGTALAKRLAGFDMDITGQITDKWDIYASYTWIPEARVDEAAPPQVPHEPFARAEVARHHV